MTRKEERVKGVGGIRGYEVRTWWRRKKSQFPAHPPDCEKGWVKRGGSSVKCVEGVDVVE